MLSAAFVAVTVASVILLSLATRERIFDRYLLSTVPYASALVLLALPSRASRVTAAAGVSHYGSLSPQRWAAVVVSGLLAVMATGLVAGSAALDGTKWRLGEATAAQGFSADTVDAGLEWFGMHQNSKVVRRPFTAGVTAGAYSFWVTGLFEAPRVCAIAWYTSNATTALLTDRATGATGPRHRVRHGLGSPCRVHLRLL